VAHLNDRLQHLFSVGEELVLFELRRSHLHFNRQLLRPTPSSSTANLVKEEVSAKASVT
jgi:hypothetical protein